MFARRSRELRAAGLWQRMRILLWFYRLVVAPSFGSSHRTWLQLSMQRCSTVIRSFAWPRGLSFVRAIFVQHVTGGVLPFDSLVMSARLDFSMVYSHMKQRHKFDKGSFDRKRHQEKSSTPQSHFELAWRNIIGAASSPCRSSCTTTWKLVKPWFRPSLEHDSW